MPGRETSMWLLIVQEQRQSRQYDDVSDVLCVGCCTDVSLVSLHCCGDTIRWVCCSLYCRNSTRSLNICFNIVVWYLGPVEVV
jgi:hypothetical protein